MPGAPRILVLRAAGINCDEETAGACELAGGRPERVHVNRFADGSCDLLDYAAVIIPGGFSYGDHLGAGKLLAIDLIHRLGAALSRLVEDGRPVLGICNGFQVLVKAGLLPGDGIGPNPPTPFPRRERGAERGPNPATPGPTREGGAELPSTRRGGAGGGTNSSLRQMVTLAGNASGHYECRWVRLVAQASSPCIFTRGLAAPFTLPVGHGEGRLVAGTMVLDRIEAGGYATLRYADVHGRPAVDYPDNPNGSANSIAGLCNASGTVFGLMPHPDRAFLPQLHPDWLRDRRRQEGDGLPIFRNMVQYAKEL